MDSRKVREVTPSADHLMADSLRANIVNAAGQVLDQFAGPTEECKRFLIANPTASLYNNRTQVAAASRRHVL